MLVLFLLAVVVMMSPAFALNMTVDTDNNLVVEGSISFFHKTHNEHISLADFYDSINTIVSSQQATIDALTTSVANLTGIVQNLTQTTGPAGPQGPAGPAGADGSGDTTILDALEPLVYPVWSHVDNETVCYFETDAFYLPGTFLLSGCSVTVTALDLIQPSEPVTLEVVSSNLPAGLSFDVNTQVLSGTVVDAADVTSAMKYSLKLRATTTAGMSSERTFVVEAGDSLFVMTGDVDGDAIENAHHSLTDGEEMGYMSAVSTDGRTIVAGAPKYLGNAGAVYIYTYDVASGQHLQTHEVLYGSAVEEFGIAVDISGDGSQLAVGAHKTADMGTASGAVYVYTLFTLSGVYDSDGRQTLYAGDPAANDLFGSYVSFTHTGGMLAVSAIQEDGEALSWVNYGSVYLFARDFDGYYFQFQKLTAADAQNTDVFGFSIDLSGDGQTIAVGAPYEDGGAVVRNDVGAVYCSFYGGVTFDAQQIIYAGGGVAGDQFGRSVSLSYDGGILAVGSYTGDGKVFIYHLNLSSQYVDEQQLVPSGIHYSGAYFGHAVKLSLDGSTLVVGSPGDDGAIGGVYRYTNNNDVFENEQVINRTDVEVTSWFGNSVAVTGNGKFIVGSSNLEDGVSGEHPNGGAIYTFQFTA